MPREIVGTQHHAMYSIDVYMRRQATALHLPMHATDINHELEEVHTWGQTTFVYTYDLPHYGEVNVTFKYQKRGAKHLVLVHQIAFTGEERTIETTRRRAWSTRTFLLFPQKFSWTLIWNHYCRNIAPSYVHAFFREFFITHVEKRMKDWGQRASQMSHGSTTSSTLT